MGAINNDFMYLKKDKNFVAKLTRDRERERESESESVPNRINHKL